MRIGDWPASPEVTALLEGAGATLAWDVLADAPVPAARIDDPERAAEWLWEIYGPAADEVLDGASEVDVPVIGDWRVRDACRTVAAEPGDCGAAELDRCRKVVGAGLTTTGPLAVSSSTANPRSDVPSALKRKMPLTPANPLGSISAACVKR